MKKNIESTVAIVVGVVAIVVIWSVAAFALNDEMMMPAPSAVAKEFIAIFGEKSTYKSIIGTLWRSTISFSVAFAFAVLFALAANVSSFCEKLFYPLIALVRVVPAMSIIFICLVWVKADNSPIVISFIVVFPMTYSAVLNAMKNRDKKVAEMLKVYGVKPSKVFFGVTLPDVFDRLFPELVSVLAFNVKLTVSGEAIAYTKFSIGREMSRANAFSDMTRLMALTLIAVLLSVVIELVVKAVYILVKRRLRDYGRKKSSQGI